MGRSRSSELLGIAAPALDLVLGAAADSHPNEYMGLLRGERAAEIGLDREGVVVTEVLVVPATETNPVSATVRTSLVPNDFRVVGSVHSHPNGVCRPSDADLATFSRGSVHLIVGAPYRERDWQAFDREGYRTNLRVLDVEVDAEARYREHDADFFDFTQADIDAELAAEGRDSRRTDDDSATDAVEETGTVDTDTDSDTNTDSSADADRRNDPEDDGDWFLP
jgi:proteasome lid subunit RPN8/RPN11